MEFRRMSRGTPRMTAKEILRELPEEPLKKFSKELLSILFNSKQNFRKSFRVTSGGILIGTSGVNPGKNSGRSLNKTFRINLKETSGRIPAL